MNSYQNQRGITLIELVVSISIFSVVMIIALDSFLNVIKFNREAVQKQSIQDHSEFLFTMMSKEIRMAKVNYNVDTSICNDAFFSRLTPATVIPGNHTYLAVDKDGDGKNEELRFQNYEELCVRYFVEYDPIENADRLKIDRYDPQLNDLNKVKEAWVLPKDIRVSELNFQVTNIFDLSAPSRRRGPSVGYFIKLSSSIWSPSQVSFFNFLEGRNVEQF